MRADWAGYCDRVAAMLREGRDEVTHTIDRIKSEIGSPKSVDELGDPNEWRYAAEGRPYHQTATNRDLALTPHVDENNRVVAVTFRLAKTLSEPR